MQRGRASRTAEFMALFRALESGRPEHSRLFADPFARGFLRPLFQLVVTLSRLPVVGSLVPRVIDWGWPGARPCGVARTCLIDDAMVAALREGLDQVVILGAGFDSRAYRLQALQGARVFEVDHPQTSAVKRTGLRRRLGALPEHVAFVEVNFDRQTLEAALGTAGFDKRRRTFFIWEGVSNYLHEQAVDATLRFIGSAAPGSRVLFTYLHKGLLDEPARFGATRWIGRTLREVGEEWTFGLYPRDVPAYLEARGLRLLEDIGSREYRARYLRSGGRELKGFEFCRIALARVGAPGGNGENSSGAGIDHGENPQR